MSELTDEKLMAFHDGELKGEEAETVRRAVERDPQLRERLMRLRDVDDQLRAAFSADLDMPERFAKILEPQGASNVVRLERKPLRTRNWIPLGAGIAAGLAGLVAGSLLTAQTAPWLEQVDDGIAITGAVQSVASRTASGELVKAHGLAMTPILSFVANDGRMCRELHVRGDQMAARIVACRDRDEDEWCVEALARMPVEDFPQGYHTAAAPKDPVIDAAFARLGVKATLDPDGEKQAIARGWKSK
jgi:hypothetical protein